MTKFQALFVKYLRVRCEGTWRWVDAKYKMRYNQGLPFNLKITYIGNQLDGIALCEEAMELLNDKIEDGWN